MRQTLLSNARAIADRLDPAETNLGLALVNNAELIAAIGRARHEMNISVAFGHDVMSSLSAANGLILEGLAKTIDAHKGLAVIGNRFGVSVTATGGGVLKDPDDVWAPMGARLAVVRDEPDAAAA